MIRWEGGATYYCTTLTCTAFPKDSNGILFSWRSAGLLLLVRPLQEYPHYTLLLDAERRLKCCEALQAAAHLLNHSS